MSALVGYASSDEEDEPEQEAPSNQNNVNGAIKLSATGHILTSEERDASEATVGPIVGPMVGPTIPDSLPDDGEIGPSEDGQPPMSERDAVRYLTQPSHPMTSLPPSPPGSPNPVLNAKFKKFLELKAKGVHFNEDLANKSSFRNPALVALMMERIGLESHDQYATSIEKSIWNPLDVPSSAYKEVLLESQQTIRDRDSATKKALSASGRRTIEFTAGENPESISRDSTPGIPGKRKKP